MKVAMLPHRSRRSDNPYVSILADHLGRHGCEAVPAPTLGGDRFGALHVHWLETPLWGFWTKRVPRIAEYRARRILRLARRMRQDGAPVVWTAHNLTPHEVSVAHQRHAYRIMCDDFLPNVSDVICMSETGRREVERAFPELARARVHVVPHPHYVDYFARIPRAIPSEAEDFSKKNVPTMLTFGQLRAYKGIPDTVKVMRGLKRDFRFIVAGPGPDAETTAIRTAMADDPRFLLIGRQITDAEIAGLIEVADLVLFNFENILNSGSIMAALSLGRPVLAPNLGAIADLQAMVGHRWVRLFEGRIAAGDIESALLSLPLLGMPDLRAFNPDVVARQHALIYRSGIER